jgi:hypothetical protein
LSSSRGWWLAIGVEEQAAAPTATYEGKLSVRCKATKVGAASDSTVDVRLGYEWEKEDDDVVVARARDGSDTKKRRRRARRLRLRTVGPAHYAARGRKEKG